MKLTKIETFMDERGNILQFFPSKECPGFSHRVILNGANTRRWLSNEAKPNKKSAQFFLEHLLSMAKKVTEYEF